jgi:hypothetical protein
MELIQELKEIALELAAETGLSHSEALQIAVQIQRNRILEDSFLAGRSENISFFSSKHLD